MGRTGRFVGATTKIFGNLGLLVGNGGVYCKFPIAENHLSSFVVLKMSNVTYSTTPLRSVRNVMYQFALSA